MSAWIPATRLGEAMFRQMAGSLHQDFDLMRVSIQEAFGSAIFWRCPEERSALIETLSNALEAEPSSAPFEELFVGYGACNWSEGADIRAEAETFLQTLRARQDKSLR